jgi:predicted Mrr-cat superfamily restriction endonuclease
VGVFQSKSVVAIGWYGVDWTKFSNSRGIQEWLESLAPEKSVRQRIAAASQILRFLRSIEVEDRVTTYDGQRRLFLLGLIKGAPTFEPRLMQELPTIRAVKWDGTVQRDKLSQKTRKALGAISTLFLVSDSAVAELEANREPL